MTDSLLAAVGMLSPSLAGQALALDYMELEQQRQMTIKAANITLYYEYDNVPYVINLIDTPGHIDFTGKVTRSLRAIDGAVVVIDAVEGVMTQTETVTRQALEERVRPVLYINKIDRLIKELRLPPEKMQSWLANIIGDFNQLIDAYAEPEFRDKWKVNIQQSNVALGSAKDRWGFSFEIAQKKNVRFSEIYKAYEFSRVKELSEKLPLHDAILSMIIKHIPSPRVAQKYRIPKIWKGETDSAIGRTLLSCDENAPIVMMVTNVVVDPQAGVVAIGRLFSGTVKSGEVVYLSNAKTEGRIQSVAMFMGPFREVVDHLPAGNIPALLGLEHARAGETISSIKGVVPFEQIRYISEPVVTVAIEPKYPRDLLRLVEILKKMSIEDPNLLVKINEETGETLMSGMGVLHLEIVTTLISENNIEVVTSKPLINYRESIRSGAGPVMAKSPNKHNRIFIRVEPLSPEVIELIRKGEISEYRDRKTIAKTLREHGWDAEEARNVVAVDPRGNVFVDATKGVQFMQESIDSVRIGFFDVMECGPLAQEPCRGIKVTLRHAEFHEDPAHRTYAQLVPASRRAMLGAILLANPVLLEPIMGIEVTVPTDMIGPVSAVISSKRGKTISIMQRNHFSTIQGSLPASETFDLSEAMRGATAGRALWNTYFKEWGQVPASMAPALISEIRKRKGVAPTPPRPEELIDKE